MEYRLNYTLPLQVHVFLLQGQTSWWPRWRPSLQRCFVAERCWRKTTSSERKKNVEQKIVRLLGSTYHRSVYCKKISHVHSTSCTSLSGPSNAGGPLPPGQAGWAVPLALGGSSHSYAGVVEPLVGALKRERTNIQPVHLTHVNILPSAYTTNTVHSEIHITHDLYAVTREHFTCT